MLALAGGDRFVEREAIGIGETHRHGGVADGGADEAAGGFEAQFAIAANGVLDVAGETARAVAAHFGVAAVCVVKVPRPIAFALGVSQEDKTIGADATLAVAEFGDLFTTERGRAVAVINQHEVVARAVHFGELNLHRKRLVKMRHQFNSDHNWVIASRS